jgi:hypothetical protein
MIKEHNQAAAHKEKDARQSTTTQRMKKETTGNNGLF